MNSTIATAAVATNQAMARQQAQMSMIKQQHEMQMSLISMLTEAVESAPVPEGVGGVVDRTA